VLLAQYAAHQLPAGRNPEAAQPYMTTWQVAQINLTPLATAAISIK